MDKVIHIAVVDDDLEIRNLLSGFLSQHGYKISIAKDGKELLAMLAKDNTIELIVLDIMMPGMDGIELCRQLRQSSAIPIIMLTAVNNEADRIIGLELGADDYLAKPFNPRELLARIKAVLRRASEVEKNFANHATKSVVLEFQDWTLDITTRRLLSPDNIEVPLSSGTYDLLVAFLEHPQRVLSRDQLMDMTKNRLAEPFDRSIDVQVSRLRQKIEMDPKNPQVIKTVRAGGYLFTVPVRKRNKIA